MKQMKIQCAFYPLFFLLCFAILPFSVLHAEGDEDGTANIRGKVLTNEGSPGQGVTVLLKGTKKRNIITDDDGISL